MCLTGARVRSRRRVPLQHRSGLPARETHEVAFVAAGLEPSVRERVSQDVRVQVLDPGLLAASFPHLADAAVPHPPDPRQPERGEFREPMTFANAKVTV